MLDHRFCLQVLLLAFLMRELKHEQYFFRKNYLLQLRRVDKYCALAEKKSFLWQVILTLKDIWSKSQQKATFSIMSCQGLTSQRRHYSTCFSRFLLTLSKFIIIQSNSQSNLKILYFIFIWQVVDKQARGPKKHLKRIAAPKSWMLNKLGGIYATRPSQGPHKLRQCIPMAVLLKNRLKYAMNGRQVGLILNDKEGGVKVDGKIRRDRGFPLGIMDNVTIIKSKQNFRIMYDTKGRFVIVPIKFEEAKVIIFDQFKLLRVRHKALGNNRIPYITTHDARTIRFAHPQIDIRDTVKFDLQSNKIVDFIKFEVGNLCFVTGGNNIGRVGQIFHIQKHMGGYDIVHVRDSQKRTFATRSTNIFVIGKKNKSLIGLPKDKGLRLTIIEEKVRKDSKQ